MTPLQDCSQYLEVQRVLREEVVNPLRRAGYVRADRVMRLRRLLERLSDVPGLTSEEKVSLLTHETGNYPLLFY